MAAAALMVASASTAYAAFSPTPAPAVGVTSAAPKPTTPAHFIRALAVQNPSAARALRMTTAHIPPPPTMEQCVAAFGSPCYTPGQLQHAYGADTAQQRGLTGAGATIAILDSYGSPTIAADLAAFNQATGLPPANLQVVNYGDVPGGLDTPDKRGWGMETSLDVQYAHAMAPGARILLVQVAPDATGDDLGVGNLGKAMTWVVDHYQVNDMSLSWGDMEANFAEAAGSVQAGNRMLYSLRGGLISAALHHVTVLAASGDDGPTGPNLAGTALYPFPTVSWPASDPLVTGVGGTLMRLDASGTRLSPDAAWSVDGLGAAGGGGVSEAFSRPQYQNGVASVVGSQFGLPTLSANASCDSSVVVWASFGFGPTDGPGWSAVCGTSESSPLMAGLVADSSAVTHHPLGNINPVLYGRSVHGSMPGVQDVLSGCTTDFGVTGFCAQPGYDLATGWGTIGDATAYVLALAHAGARH